MESFQQTFKSERKVRRELVPGSVDVSPIKNYGAVETGIHRFYAICYHKNLKFKKSNSRYVNTILQI